MGFAAVGFGAAPATKVVDGFCNLNGGGGFCDALGNVGFCSGGFSKLGWDAALAAEDMDDRLGSEAGALESMPWCFSSCFPEEASAKLDLNIWSLSW
jgi:hypothetical protein